MEISKKAGSIVEALHFFAHKDGAKIAIIDNNEEQISYNELWNNVQGFATYLKKTGISEADKVVIKSSHTIEYVVSFLAVHLLGAISIPTEKTIGNEGLDSIVDALDASLVIANDYSSKVKVVSADSVKELAREYMPKDEMVNFPDTNSLGDILFTTGTTGKSKGVMISHRAIIAVCENVIEGVNLASDNIYLVPSPINHASGIRKIYVSILTGTTVVLLDGFMNLKKFFQFAKDYKITSILMPPSAIRIIMMMARDNMAELSGQLDHIHSGSAPLSDADKQRLRDTLPNTRLYFAYGSSEAGCSTMYDYNEYKDVVNSCGKPNVNAHILIVDDEGNEIVGTKDKPGIVAIKGSMNMEGYYNEPELTAEVLKDGIVYTTDIGYMEDGFLHLLGRKDDVINIGGLKIAPTEVESIALKYPGVSECICYATFDNRDNIKIAMDIVLEKKTDFDKVKFSEFLGETLEAFKIPKIVNLVDEIAKTSNGKVDRKKYR